MHFCSHPLPPPLERFFNPRFFFLDFPRFLFWTLSYLPSQIALHQAREIPTPFLTRFFADSSPLLKKPAFLLLFSLGCPPPSPSSSTLPFDETTPISSAGGVLFVCRTFRDGLANRQRFSRPCATLRRIYSFSGQRPVFLRVF